jgi:hypothetical protein
MTLTDITTSIIALPATLSSSTISADNSSVIVNIRFSAMSYPHNHISSIVNEKKAAISEILAYLEISIEHGLTIFGVIIKTLWPSNLD